MVRFHHGRAFGWLGTSVAATWLVLASSGCCGGDKEEASASSAPAPTAAVSPCPANYKALSAADKAGTATCTCAPGAAKGSVWGSDIYTTDSSICAAALHAGVIAASGGTVTVKGAAGCPAYAGSARNGVSSGKWGSYEGSFYFPAKGDGKCSAAAPSAGPCPTNFKSVPGLSATTSITCSCNGSLMSGSVWGSDIYTQDSSICRAAVHAGAIGASGGEVTAKAAPGCKSYVGNARNGVTTSKWGSFDASFYFPSKGTGTCP